MADKSPPASLTENIGAFFHHLPMEDKKLSEDQTPLVLHVRGEIDLTEQAVAEFDLDPAEVHSILRDTLLEIDPELAGKEF